MSFLFLVQYHPAAVPSAILDSIRREGLTEQQQTVVEEQIAAASMEQINYRVGGFPVAPCGCRMLYVADRLLTTTLPTWPCSCCFIHILFCCCFRLFVALACFKNCDGFTCLHVSARYGYPGMLRALLRRGVQVNAQYNSVNITCFKCRVFLF